MLEDAAFPEAFPVALCKHISAGCKKMEIQLSPIEEVRETHKHCGTLGTAVSSYSKHLVEINEIET